MKIAFLCNNMKSYNGVERVLSQRLSLLAESGLYDVYLITYNQYGVPFSFPISGKVHYIDLATRYISRCSYHGLYQYIDRFLSKKIYNRTIRRCLKKIDPDVVTCMDMHLADLEVVLHLGIRAKKVVECHCGLSAYYTDLMKFTRPIQRYRQRSLKDKLVYTISKFDKIVVMTKEERDDWGIEDKAVVIPNMLVDYPINVEERPLPFCKIISVGRYAYQKGYDILIDSWKIVQERHPEWYLHLYGSRDGDNGEYRVLQHKIEDSEITNVCLHSATNDIYQHYCESDFYVMSSRYESFGLVLIEAMSCGLPVVSFDCKYGPLSIVKDSVTGKLVPKNDIVKMADAICSLIENGAERLRMAQNARKESVKYKPEYIMPLWHEFYKSLAADCPRVS